MDTTADLCRTIGLGL